MAVPRRVNVALAFGVIALAVPVHVYAYIMYTQTYNPGAFNDQGGMFISFILTPIAFLGAMAGAVAASVIGADVKPRPKRKRAAVILGLLGVVLSFGTPVVPQVLAEMMR